MTNLRLKNALISQRAYLNNWRDKLNKQRIDLDKERIRLTRMHNFVKNTQSLQDKVQLHIQETTTKCQFKCIPCTFLSIKTNLINWLEKPIFVSIWSYNFLNVNVFYMQTGKPINVRYVG